MRAQPAYIVLSIRLWKGESITEHNQSPHEGTRQEEDAKPELAASDKRWCPQRGAQELKPQDLYTSQHQLRDKLSMQFL